MTKPVTIVGAGGIGGTVGYALAARGIAVEFVEVDDARIDDGASHGIRVDTRPALPARFTRFRDWLPGAGDRIVLCVKCYDNAAVLDRLPPGADLLPVQNGIDERLEARGHAAGAIASYVAAAEPGRAMVRITRPGDLHIGGRAGAVPEWVCELATALRAAGLFRVRVVDRIAPYQHSKLMYNAAIAPLAAAAGLDNAALLERADARSLFFRFLLENHAILSAAGKPMGRVGPFHPDTVSRILRRRWLARAFARAFVPGLRGTYCSMAGDIERGRTEVGNYNGALAAWAGPVPCPLNRAAVEIVTRMARYGVRPHPDVLRSFEAGAVELAQ
jgi:2-dehydropantoate 2-reductase